MLYIQNAEKSYGEKLLFKIDNLQINKGDKVGIIGENGSGKTTLLKAIIGEEALDSGEIKINGTYNYSKQFLDNDSHLSGGEQTRRKNKFLLNDKVDLIIADEPTSNLSLKNIELLKKRFIEFNGAIIVVSHNIDFLDSVCNKILEIDRGEVKFINGNYSTYMAEKDKQNRMQSNEYNKVTSEINRLKKQSKLNKDKGHKLENSKPKGAGNSEARLYKGSIRDKAKKVSDGSKVLDAQIKILERNQIEKPKNYQRSKFEIPSHLNINSKVLISDNNINKKFGKKIIFNNAKLIVEKNKYCILGDNGAGKTTLINMIINNEISINPNVKIGYMNQNLKFDNEEMTVLEYASSGTSKSKTYIYNTLAKLLLKNSDLNKTINVLSGGEKIKLALAEIFLRDINLMILDEPNNFLDIYSLQSLEELIEDYNGYMIMVTHNKRLIEKFNNYLIIEDKKIRNYQGDFENAFVKKKNINIENQIILLEQEKNNLLMSDLSDDKLERIKEIRCKIDELKQ